jgi:hypothetical protein
MYVCMYVVDGQPLHCDLQDLFILIVTIIRLSEFHGDPTSAISPGSISYLLGSVSNNELSVKLTAYASVQGADSYTCSNVNWEEAHSR